MTEPLIRTLEEGSICVGLDYRIGIIAACDDPECPCNGKPTYLVAVKEAEEHWWGVAGFTDEPEAMVNRMAGDPEIMRVATSTILFGASWEAIESKPWFVYEAQLHAVANTPRRYWELGLEELKGFRSMINSHNPREVCALLNMTDKWAFDVGGTSGAAS